MQLETSLRCLGKDTIAEATLRVKEKELANFYMWMVELSGQHQRHEDLRTLSNL